MNKIKKILIANRAEIAVRVIRTCRELGIQTVTLYTEGEEKLPHVTLADESYSLGEFTNLASTYLNKNKIIELAKSSGADAIHPGYGFLSENAEFSDLVTKSGLIFIGPTGDSMRLMGDKMGSKNKMIEIKVPVIPGYNGENQDPAHLEAEAKKIGLPLLIKASAGGGGKGMRIVRSHDEFREALDMAQSEAKNSFGDSRVLIEKYIEKPRHIEVQVFSSKKGEHFHFFERECSVQRRHQKIVEECPSSSLTKEQRLRICETATMITKGIGYVGAGTVEFIWDDFAANGGDYYFLEMNTRLQVEHPVTEMVTGHDLVALQIKIAEGHGFGFTQNDLTIRGHAIEVRLYAEDPDQNFMPSIGKLSFAPGTQIPSARIDSGVISGSEVGVNFDPMLAKMIAWGENRDRARLRLRELLITSPFLGFKNNRDYLLRVLKHPQFVEGKTYTSFVKDYETDLEKKGFDDLSKVEKAQVLAAIIARDNDKNSANTGSVNTINSTFETLGNFRNV